MYYTLHPLSPLLVPFLQGVVISQQKTAQGQTLSIQGAKVLKLHFREKALEEQLKQHEQRATEKQTHQTHSREVEISQFWQYLHARLQPAVPKDRIVEPGSTCARGFFSTGSRTKPEERP